MFRIILSAGLALALTAPAGAQTALPQSVSVAQPLEVIVNFFVPAAPVEIFTVDVCDGRVRASLLGNAAMVEIERQLPGVIDRQVAATADYCRREVHTLLARWQERVRDDWRTTSPADLARLARMMAVATNEALSASGPRTATADENARLRAAQVALAKTPGGAALLQRVVAYQQRLKVRITPPEGADHLEMMAVLTAALAEGRKAANAYAKEKGKPAIYDDAATI